jgi:hypothetical protein
MDRRRWLLAGTIVLAAAQCGSWLFDTLIAWSAAGWLVSTLLALELTIGAGLNILGLLAFLLRGWGFSRSAFPAVQVGNILFSVGASVVISPVWLLLGAAPALATLILFFLFRREDVTPTAPGYRV